MTAHTPGPWHFEVCTLGHPDNKHNFIVECEHGYVARMFSESSTIRGLTSHAPDEETAKANARLIASAPTLYFALKRIIDDLPTNRDWLDPDIERLAKEAIAKAGSTT